MASQSMRRGPAGFVVAAPSSNSGKTLVTLGLMRALKRGGVAVRPAKSGPDYIDPQFLARAAGEDCLNLDAWAMSSNRLRALAETHAGPERPARCRGRHGAF